MSKQGYLAALMLLIAGPALAEAPADPLKSPMWNEMARSLLQGGEIAFDERVIVTVPSIVENQAQVPVTVDARGLGDVAKLVVFADLNPKQHVLTLTPTHAAAYISFRMKVEQATPVRAAALGKDGIWHVGHIYLQASGGGCSAPALARQDADWSVTVGEAQGRLWPAPDGYVKARIRVRHPMDTGLAKDNTPSYFIERLELRSSAKEPLATLEMFEPVSEDPTLTILPALPAGDTALDVESRDNNGNIYRSRIPAPWRQSGLAPLPVSKPSVSPC